MTKRVTLFLSGSVLFALFIFFSLLVAKHKFNQFDFDTTVKIQDHVSDFFSEFFSYFSLLGSAEVITVVLVGVLGFLLIKKHGFKNIWVLPFYFVVFALGLYGKLFVKHPGPPFMFYHYKLDFLFPSTYVQTGNSYPSGHSARTVFISIFLIAIILKNKKLSRQTKLISVCLLLITDFLMLLTRVYLGEHWTSDVIGGGILGLSLGLITSALL